MLGGAIAARPLARDGLGRLTSGMGRTRLAAPPLPIRDESEAAALREGGAKAARAGTAAATRP